jgi:protease-4
MVTPPRRHPPLLLELDLTEALAEPDVDDPLGRLRARTRRQLRPTLRALYEAADDRHVVGLIAKVGGSRLPWAVMQELRLGIEAFAARGRPAVAWAESFGEAAGGLPAYVLASAFGEIWLQPGGEIGPMGVGVETTFLRGALDKLGVEPQFEQRYEYKNAADQLLRREFTPAHRESLERLTQSMFTDATAMIAAARAIEPARLREILDGGPHTAPEAQESRLVDRLGYRDEAYAAVRARVDPDAELLFADRWRPRWRPSVPRRRKGHVALVQARGVIVSGRSRRAATGRQVGSDSVGAQLRAVLTDDRAKAVLLRVESPGGSAVGSDSIWREVCRVRDAGKPVIVSMGEVAASGGYYVSCPADVIVALPATITGSIGVLGGKFVVRDLLERLGLTTGTVQQGARALMYSGRRGFDEQERARLAATIDAVYADFVAKVAAGRHREVEQIEAVARGRVWTGRDALEAGLIDQLGGMREALVVARTRAGLPDDAPVLPALHVSPLARLGRAKNSEDPRALLSASWPGLPDLAATFGVLDEMALRMPPISLR